MVAITVPSLRTLTLHDNFSEAITARGMGSGITSFLRNVHLPNLASLTLDMRSASPLRDIRAASSSSILSLSLSVQTFGLVDSEALGKFLAFAPSMQHFALQVQGDVDLELVFWRATNAFAELPIHSLTFTASGSITVSQTNGLSLAGHTFSSIWRKGVFKMLSIHRASCVGDDAITTLRDLVEEGLL